MVTPFSSLALSRPPRGGRQRLLSAQTLALCALSGVLLIGAFPHLDCAALAWVALAPLLLTFPHRSWRGALAAGTVTGIVFFGGLVYWIDVFAAHAVGPVLGGVAWAGTTLSQAATVTVFALGAQALARHPRRGAWLLGVPALWTALEWARQFGILGTTWGDLAWTQHRVLPLLQITKLTGPWGLSFLLVFVNGVLAEGGREGRGYKTPGREVLIVRWTKDILSCVQSTLSSFCRGFYSPGTGVGTVLGAGLAVTLSLFYGLYTLHTERLRPTFVAAALQGNINQNVTLSPAYTQRVLDTFAAQSRLARARGALVTVWPETAVPGYLRYDPHLFAPIAQLAQRNEQTLLVGARDYAPAQKKDSNTLFLVTPQGTLAGAYSKQHLVPFGEYVPLHAQFPILDKLHLSIYDMLPGPPHQPLLHAPPPIGQVGAAICYDSTYTNLLRAEVAAGAGLLVVTTDDTWFGRTAAANQHAAMAAVGAASTDRYLVRCAATGISQIIDPTGRVIASAPLFAPAVVSASVQARATRTPYVRFGDWFIVFCALVIGAALVTGRRA